MTAEAFWLTTLAGIIAAALSVFATRFFDERRFLKERRMQIFRVLMRDRGLQNTADYVAALNLIDIEFKGEQKVLNAWAALRSSFFKKPIDFDEKNKNTVGLLLEMAISLGYKNIDRMAIKDEIYFPEWMGQSLENQKVLNDALIAILTGKSSLKVEKFCESERQDG